MEEKLFKIILADDHEIMLDGLSNIIKPIPNIEIINFAKNGEELINYVDKRKPDLCIVDIDMPKINGLDASKILLEKYPDIKIIILSMHKEISLIRRVRKMGVKGYLVKTSDKDEFIFAINQVLKGKTYFLEEIPNENIIRTILDKSETEKINTITKREYEIIQLLCDGESNKQIAKKLFISHKTVDNHRASIMNKLEVHNVVELVRYCYRNNLLKE